MPGRYCPDHSVAGPANLIPIDDLQCDDAIALVASSEARQQRTVPLVFRTARKALKRASLTLTRLSIVGRIESLVMNRPDQISSFQGPQTVTGLNTMTGSCYLPDLTYSLKSVTCGKRQITGDVVGSRSGDGDCSLFRMPVAVAMIQARAPQAVKQFISCRTQGQGTTVSATSYPACELSESPETPPSMFSMSTTNPDHVNFSAPYPSPVNGL